MTEKQTLQKLIFLCRTIQREAEGHPSSRKIIKWALHEIRFLKSEATLKNDKKI